MVSLITELTIFGCLVPELVIIVGLASTSAYVTDGWALLGLSGGCRLFAPDGVLSLLHGVKSTTAVVDCVIDRSIATRVLLLSKVLVSLRHRQRSLRPHEFIEDNPRLIEFDQSSTSLSHLFICLLALIPTGGCVLLGRLARTVQLLDLVLETQDFLLILCHLSSVSFILGLQGLELALKLVVFSVLTLELGEGGGVKLLGLHSLLDGHA